MIRNQCIMYKIFGYLITLSVLTIVVSQESQFRLPRIARPLNYSLTIETFMNNLTFRGSVDIFVEILSLTDRIMLHSKDLNILEKSVSGVDVLHTMTDLTRDFIIMVVNRPLVNGAVHKISIEYNATLGTENVGYYAAPYVNENGQTRYIAVTQFESTHARRAFPCFDEPNYKAVFQIHLLQHKDYITASNMDRVGYFNAKYDRVHYTYYTSLEMSTYLVAFMVSDYNNVTLNRNGIRYRTFGRAEHINRGEGAYSLQVAPNAIETMQNFTNIPYPIVKLDLVAVPNDHYKSGAMENWGMTTYREKYLMFNSSTRTAAEMQYITTIITHELAHQWFGNLVTPEWWNFVWLKEGFATYFEVFATTRFEPTWNLVEQFIIGMMQPAFEADSLETTKPMTRNVESPDDIEEIYDTISYEKAASVIRMAANFLGETVFQNGLRNYLINWQFQNVNPTHLYDSWQALSININISNIMAPWEIQSGYPVVTVTRFANGTAHLNQNRFLQYRANHTDRTLWPIPLNWFTVNTATPLVTWFNVENQMITLSTNISQWIIFNINRTGYYRVNYDVNNWRLIVNYLTTGNFPAINVINRAQLIDDAFSLARSLRLGYPIALDLGSYVVNETDYVPIVTFTTSFGHLDRLSTGQRHHETMRRYGRNILEGYFNRTGFINQTDTHLVKLTKVTVLTWLCRLNHGPCRNNSATVFGNWITSSTPIQPDSQHYVFCNGIRDGNESMWNIALERYRTLREDTQRTRIAQGLGCANNTFLLRRLLDIVIAESSTFGSSDRVKVITSVYSNNDVLGVNVVLDWFIHHFNEINKRVSSVKDIITGVTNRITTNEQLMMLVHFNNTYAANFTTEMNTTLRIASDTVQNNLLWINSTASVFDNHFSGIGGDCGTGAMIYAHVSLIFICIFLQLLYT